MTWRMGKTHREWLIELFSELLGDEEAAGWIVERKAEKIASLRERFSGRRIALVSFDVDRIKDFVFGSTKPLEIQGASAMVKDMEENGAVLQAVLKKTGLDGGHVLFAGGGTGLLIAPEDKAETLCHNLSEEFARETGAGSCAVARHVFAPHELVGGPAAPAPAELPAGVDLVRPDEDNRMTFGRLVGLLADELRELKGEKLMFPAPPLPGFIARCDSCGVRGAEETDTVGPGEKKDRLCAPCMGKRKRGRQERNRMKRALEPALTVEQIAGDDGCYAIIYADADNMGRTLMALRSMSDYALFSRAAAEALRTLRDDLIQCHGLAGRYQAPVLGGDDLVLLTPAPKAASVALDIRLRTPEHFERKIEEAGLSGHVANSLREIGMSVGFVVIPAHFDIRYALEYAEVLLRSAKREGRERKTACIDYQVVKDSSPLNFGISELRKAQVRKTRKWSIRMTRKPLTPDAFSELLRRIDLLRRAGISKNQLHRIVAYLTLEPPKAASLLTRCQLVRVKSWDKVRERLPAENVQDLVTDLNILTRLEHGDVDYETGFLDLMELYDFQEMVNG